MSDKSTSIGEVFDVQMSSSITCTYLFKYTFVFELMGVVGLARRCECNVGFGRLSQSSGKEGEGRRRTATGQPAQPVHSHQQPASHKKAEE